MYCNNRIIAIDGGCRTSKSRLARELSYWLNIPFLDSGLLYRAFARVWREDSFSVFFDKPLAFYEQYSKIDIVFDKHECTVFANGVLYDPHEEKHSLDILTSKIAENIPIRLYLTNIIHTFVADKEFIITGRDISTFVFPQTRFKVFLTQSYIVDDVNSQKMIDIRERDTRDINREFAPLKPSQDQLKLDTSLYSFEENLSLIKDYLLEKGWVR